MSYIFIFFINLFSFNFLGKVEGVGPLSHVADELMNQLNQREIVSDSLLEWLLQSHEGVDEVFQNNGWRLTLFVEGLLCRCVLSGGTITGIISLVDR